MTEPDLQMFQKNTEHTGISSAPAIEEPEVKWKTCIGIQGYLNNPVVVNGCVFRHKAENVFAHSVYLFGSSVYVK